MTPLTQRQADIFATHLAQAFGATLVRPTDSTAQIVRAVLGALVALVPGGGLVSSAVSSRFDGVSVTVPTPLGVIVLLSEAAVATPASLVETVAHEAVHCAQIAAAGGVQAAVDYLGSGELRAQREADAHACGAFVAYLLGGPELHAHDLAALYHLDPTDQALARGILASHAATVAEGFAPPIAAARVALAWLCEHALECIRPEWRWVPW